jgi:hypothetical protein
MVELVLRGKDVVMGWRDCRVFVPRMSGSMAAVVSFLFPLNSAIQDQKSCRILAAPKPPSLA